MNGIPVEIPQWLAWALSALCAFFLVIIVALIHLLRAEQKEYSKRHRQLNIILLAAAQGRSPESAAVAMKIAEEAERDGEAPDLEEDVEFPIDPVDEIGREGPIDLETSIRLDRAEELVRKRQQERSGER